jgi:uncharacterized membrane protein
MLVLIISLTLIFISPLYLILYFFAVLVKIRRQKLKRIIAVFFRRILHDILIFLAHLFFYPSSPQFTINQIEVKN